MAPISDIQRQTFTEIYETYSGKLFGVCLHYVHDHDIACDLLHDSFIVIFSSLDQLRDSSRLEAWMCSIVRNIALKHLRKSHKMPQTGLENIPEPCMEDHGADVSEIPLDELLKIVDELPEQYGKVFRLSVLDGLSHQEIGEIMGIAPHSSSSNLTRAKQLLRKAVSKNWGIILTFCLCIMAVLFAVRKEDSTDIIAVNQEIWTISPEKAEIMIAELVPVKRLPDLPERYASVQTEEVPVIDQPENKENSYETVTERHDAVAVEKQEEIHEPYDDWAADDDISDSRKAGRRITIGFSGSFGNSATTTIPGTIIPGTVPPGVDMSPPGTDGNVSSGITDGTVNPPGYEEPQKPDLGTSQQTPDKQYRHAMPITFAATVRYSLTDRWAIISGLQYTYLHSDFKEGLTKESQDIHYMGIPLKMSWTFWKTPALNAYASAGMTFEFPLAGRKAGRPVDVPCQWYAGMGVGLQYDINTHFGIYVEPELYMYFNNGSTIHTIRTERPLNITIPVGIRFSW